MTTTGRLLPVLEYLRRDLAGQLEPGDRTHMRYPTAISRLLGFEIVDVGPATAAVRVQADAERHGNQQGTVHGGLIVELADAAIGTAASTLSVPGESFTSIDIRAAFLRPVWSGPLTATARPVRTGRTISHYTCEVTRADGKAVAMVTSAVMTLRGDAARGRRPAPPGGRRPARAGGEWARRGSNPRPLVCKTRALPLSYTPCRRCRVHAPAALGKSSQAVRRAFSAATHTDWSRASPGSFISANRMTPSRSTTKVPRFG